MFCHNCGKQLSLESPQCLDCGARRYDDVSDTNKLLHAYPEKLDDSALAIERCLFSVRPAFFKIAISYALAALVTVAATILIAYLEWSVIWVGTAVLVFFSSPLIRHLKRNHIIYTLRPEKIELEQGLFSRTSQNLALRHINNVSIYQSLPDRLLGIGDVLIDSVGTADKITLKSVRNPRQYANLILTQLRRRN
ncbi:MAG: PH domain-containing protein [Acidobacteria bacterium]|nr:PH domain-containing protein [Acidobacteriota bacterium]